jgi:DNA-binding response OmpR family regulator
MTEHNPRILHIEDDTDFQNYIQTLLSSRAVITQASTLSEASRFVSEGEFDLILLDLTLPDGSGMELVNQLQRKGVSTHVLIFSAHEVTDSVTGAAAVLVKGRFVESDLIATVDGLLRDSVNA